MRLFLLSLLLIKLVQAGVPDSLEAEWNRLPDLQNWRTRLVMDVVTAHDARFHLNHTYQGEQHFRQGDIRHQQALDYQFRIPLSSVLSLSQQLDHYAYQEGGGRRIFTARALTGLEWHTRKLTITGQAGGVSDFRHAILGDGPAAEVSARYRGPVQVRINLQGGNPGRRRERHSEIRLGGGFPLREEVSTRFEFTQLQDVSDQYLSEQFWQRHDRKSALTGDVRYQLNRYTTLTTETVLRERLLKREGQDQQVELAFRQTLSHRYQRTRLLMISRFQLERGQNETESFRNRHFSRFERNLLSTRITVPIVKGDTLYTDASIEKLSHDTDVTSFLLTAGAGEQADYRDERTLNGILRWQHRGRYWDYGSFYRFRSRLLNYIHADQSGDNYDNRIHQLIMSGGRRTGRWYLGAELQMQANYRHFVWEDENQLKSHVKRRFRLELVLHRHNLKRDTTRVRLYSSWDDNGRYNHWTHTEYRANSEFGNGLEIQVPQHLPGWGSRLDHVITLQVRDRYAYENSKETLASNRIRHLVQTGWQVEVLTSSRNRFRVGVIWTTGEQVEKRIDLLLQLYWRKNPTIP